MRAHTAQVETPSRSARVLTWLAVVASALLLALGLIWYDWSPEVRQRFWSDIFDRFGGPMTFRFFLQPAMATIAAVHDGIEDARSGHKAFFWTAWRHPEQRAGRLREGLTSTARILLLGLSMDVIYQLRVFPTFYPVEALVIALLLAVVPYFILRWVVELIARRGLAHKQASE